MKNKNIRLSVSLRRHIRQRKTEIRKNHGEESPQMREFLGWVNNKRQEKSDKVQGSAKDGQQ